MEDIGHSLPLSLSHSLAIKTRENEREKDPKIIDGILVVVAVLQ